MAKKMLIDATHPEETRVVVADGNKVEDFDFESASKKQIAGNIYLAKVTRVEPSLQAAFVEYGGNRHGFLAFSEIHPDYYQIPRADREALIAEEEAEARRRAQAEDESAAPRKRSRKRAAKAETPETAGETSAEGEKADASKTSDKAPEAESDASKAGQAAEEPAPKAPAEAGGQAPAAAEAEDAPKADDDAGPSETHAEPKSEAETSEAPGPDDDEETGEEGGSRTLSESAGADDEERVEEDYAPDAESASARETAGQPASDRKTGNAAETAEKPAEAEAPSSPAANDEPATAETAESGSEEAQEAASDNGEDDEGEGSAADRRRRRSRRGGRSRRSRRARSRGSESEAESSAEGEEPAPAEPRAEGAGAEPAAETESEEAGEEISTRRAFQRRYKIQEVIKVRQIMLVQVVKEERGNKGAALTTYLSLAGRYCVLMPNTARGGGISRKITNAADRKKLKDIASELEVPKGMGLIIRTAGAKRTGQEIRRDYEYLLRQWERIRETTLKSVAPTLIYEEGSLIKRAIRDLYASGIEEIVVEGEEGWREARDYISMLMPGHADNVVRHRDPVPLFAKHGVEQELASLFDPTVRLKSGGYLVIGVTEALVAIDINSGKSTKEGSIEDTALKTNLEAADEIARQLRLRDLAGLIVIDFIDMDDPKNNRAVERRMKDKLKSDRARIQLGRISAFGLMEMSRQRLRPGMLEATTQPCAHCHGTGLVRADHSLALAILRQAEGEAARNRAPELLIRAPMGVASYLLNDKRDHLTGLEGRFGVVLRVEADPNMVSPEFSVERVKTPTRKPAPAAAVTALSVLPPDLEEVEEAEVAEALPDAVAKKAPAEETPGEAEAREAAEEENGRRRRGRRGGRRRKRATGTEGEASAEAETEGKPAAQEAEAEKPAEVEGEEAPAALAEETPAADIPAPKRTRRRRKPRKSESAEAAEAAAPTAPQESPAETAGPAEEAEVGTAAMETEEGAPATGPEAEEAAEPKAAAEPAAVAETAGSPAVSTPEAAEAAPGGTAES
ncbi:MAG: Rne/Rng family ribonuclease, partial [Pseudomonadota bacterium]